MVLGGGGWGRGEMQGEFTAGGVCGGCCWRDEGGGGCAAGVGYETAQRVEGGAVRAWVDLSGRRVEGEFVPRGAGGGCCLKGGGGGRRAAGVSYETAEGVE